MFSSNGPSKESGCIFVEKEDDACFWFGVYEQDFIDKINQKFGRKYTVT